MDTGREYRRVMRHDGAERPAITEEAKAYRRGLSTIVAGEVVEIKADDATSDEESEDKPKIYPGHGCGKLGTADLTGNKIGCDDDPDETDTADEDEQHPELEDTMDPNAPPEGEAQESDDDGVIDISGVFTGSGEVSDPGAEGFKPTMFIDDDANIDPRTLGEKGVGTEKASFSDREEMGMEYWMD